MCVTRARASLFLVVGTAVLAAACEDDVSVRCGDGTVLSGGACVVAAGGGEVLSFAGVTAVAPASATSLFVAWDAARGGAPGRVRYAVFAGPSGAPVDFTRPAGTTAPGATGFYLTGLEARAYDVVVRAIDEDGRSDENAVVETGTPAPDGSPPTFGGARSAEAAGSGVVTLRWDAAGDDLTPAPAMVYLVYVGDETNDIDLTVPAVVTAPGVTSADVRGLFKGTTQYRFVVRARDAADNVDANEAIVTSKPGPDVTAPVFGGCAAAVADSAGSAMVSWTAATDDVTPPEQLAYDVFASESEVFDFARPAMTVTDATSARVDGLSSNTSWRFVCRARDHAGNQDANVVQRVTRTLADSTPPAFGGLTSATVDSLARTVTFGWTAGVDDKTPTDQLVYDVYEATAPRAQAFDRPPRASSAPGDTGVVVPDLTPDATLYWIVRARDRGGNHDANVIEATGTIGVSLSRQVQPILSRDCAVSGCHVPGNPMERLILAKGFSYGALVNVQATQSTDLRVVPFDPTASYLYKKIAQNPPPVGWQMPAPATGSVLSAAEKDLVRRWILEGAANN